MRVDIIKIIGVLVIAYPNRQVNDETIALYCRMLEDLDPKILDQAVKICIATDKFFPSVAEIREAAVEVMALASGLLSAGEAWGEIQALIRNESWRNNYEPKFSHPVVAKVVACMGGWRALSGSENQVADRARFLEIYEVEATRARRDMQFLPETRDQIQQLADGNVTGEMKQLAGRLSVREE